MFFKPFLIAATTIFLLNNLANAQIDWRIKAELVGDTVELEYFGEVQKGWRTPLNGVTIELSNQDSDLLFSENRNVYAAEGLAQLKSSTITIKQKLRFQTDEKGWMILRGQILYYAVDCEYCRRKFEQQVDCLNLTLKKGKGKRPIPDPTIKVAKHTCGRTIRLSSR